MCNERRTWTNFDVYETEDEMKDRHGCLRETAANCFGLQFTSTLFPEEVSRHFVLAIVLSQDWSNKSQLARIRLHGAVEVCTGS